MHLDLEDYRPDTPRVPQAISLREGVLASLLVHALLFIVYLLTPPPAPEQAAALTPRRDEPNVEFVHMVPRLERPATPRTTRELSDLDRRAATAQHPPDPANTTPFSVGETPEKVVGGKEEKPAGPVAPGTAPPSPTNNAATADLASKVAPTSSVPAPQPGGALGNSLRNLSRFLQDQNFDNQQGGLADQLPDIQFDSKGVEFGPWLRRFVAQVKRNWFVPQAAMALSGKVVIQFYVLRNGTITDLKVVGPSQIEAYNISAFNALKRSNPTLPLPDEYPDDRAFFTVTFHYDVRDARPAADAVAPALRLN
jgi:TonB family protein